MHCPRVGGCAYLSLDSERCVQSHDEDDKPAEPKECRDVAGLAVHSAHTQEEENVAGV